MQPQVIQIPPPPPKTTRRPIPIINNSCPPTNYQKCAANQYSSSGNSSQGCPPFTEPLNPNPQTVPAWVQPQTLKDKGECCRCIGYKGKMENCGIFTRKVLGVNKVLKNIVLMKNL